jgi:hypothetical protein
MTFSTLSTPIIFYADVGAVNILMIQGIGRDQIEQRLHEAAPERSAPSKRRRSNPSPIAGLRS